MNNSKKNSQLPNKRKIARTPAPDWATETPAPDEYDLVMFGGDGDCVEEINCSREEYEALKRALARMRGYKLPDPERETRRGKKAAA